MHLWRKLHGLHPALRWPLKWLLLTLAVALTLYPKPWLIPRVLDRMRNIEQTIDPNHPAIAELAAAVRSRLGDAVNRPDPTPADARRLLQTVQQVVYAAVPYAFDWENWGVMLYIPTVDEVFARGREDCDGRAVTSASLLRHLGYDAWVASDVQHAWVQTSFGETMSPGEGPATAGQQGVGEPAQLEASWDALANVVRGVRFALVVFPLWRLLAIVLAIWALTAHPWSPTWRRFVGGTALILALALLRDAGPRPYTGAEFEHLALLGVIMAAAGWGLLAWRSGQRASAVGGEAQPGQDAQS